jgi:hypothetical protein
MVGGSAAVHADELKNRTINLDNKGWQYSLGKQEVGIRLRGEVILNAGIKSHR